MSTLDQLFDNFLAADLRRTTAIGHRTEAVRLEQEALPKCGNCNRWMKSRECPREHNVNGYSRGPSTNGSPCQQYKEAPGVQRLRDMATAERGKALAVLEAKP